MALISLAAKGGGSGKRGGSPCFPLDFSGGSYQPINFANWTAPHGPTRGDIADRLLPPAWVGVAVEIITVVEKINPENRLNEFLVKDALRRIKIGEGTIRGGGEEARGGEQLEIVFRGAGSTKYLLGTDKNGMDIFSPLAHGARSVLGILGGYFGGWLDAIVMRTVDVSLAISLVLIAFVLAAVRGPSIENVLIVICLFLWSRCARLVQGETLLLRSQDFVAEPGSLEHLTFTLWSGIFSRTWLIRSSS